MDKPQHKYLKVDISAKTLLQKYYLTLRSGVQRGLRAPLKIVQIVKIFNLEMKKLQTENLQEALYY